MVTLVRMCPPKVLLALALAAVTSACALPRWPVSGVLTSPYGLRFRGIRPDLHEGVDVAAPEGTPVRAVMGGTVRFAGEQGGYGNVVYLDHGGSITVYAHLRSIAVERGARVAHGQVIGEVGRTGSASGPHLHLEVWRNGRSEDPVGLLGGFPPGQARGGGGGG
jgi:murein DD-endopeptidase MepM/ murein hydrolase activator NlpD